MSTPKNAARVAVKAAALSKQAPRDVFDCIAADIPRNEWERALNNDEAQAWNTWLSQSEQSDCKRIFGVAHPLDVIGPMNSASESLFWLEQLFETIAADPAVTPRIKRLADMGAYISADYANYLDAEHEQMRDTVLKGGAQ